MVVAFYGLKAKVYLSPGMPNETRFVDMANDNSSDVTPRSEFNKKIDVRLLLISNKK